jgi:hypothetical protein
MPSYKINCSCGAVEGFSKIAEREANEGRVPCDDCGELNDTVLTMPAIKYSAFETPGPGGAGSYYNKQLDTTYRSRAHFEEQMEKEGMRIVSKDEAQGRALLDRAAEGAAESAQEQGYSDHAEFQAKRKIDKHKQQARAAEKKREVAEARARRGPTDPNDGPPVTVQYNREDTPRLSNREALTELGVQT